MSLQCAPLLLQTCKVCVIIHHSSSLSLRTYNKPQPRHYELTTSPARHCEHAKCAWQSIFLDHHDRCCDLVMTRVSGVFTRDDDSECVLSHDDGSGDGRSCHDESKVLLQ